MAWHRTTWWGPSFCMCTLSCTVSFRRFCLFTRGNVKTLFPSFAHWRLCGRSLYMSWVAICAKFSGEFLCVCCRLYFDINWLYRLSRCAGCAGRYTEMIHTIFQNNISQLSHLCLLLYPPIASNNPNTVVTSWTTCVFPIIGVYTHVGPSARSSRLCLKSKTYSWLCRPFTVRKWKKTFRNAGASTVMICSVLNQDWWWDSSDVSLDYQWNASPDSGCPPLAFCKCIKLTIPCLMHGDRMTWFIGWLFWEKAANVPELLRKMCRVWTDGFVSKIIVGLSNEHGKRLVIWRPLTNLSPYVGCESVLRWLLMKRL
jgi:hypothetical protein